MAPHLLLARNGVVSQSRREALERIAVAEELSACACMGVRPGDEYCYCQLKARGLSTAHYEWTEEEKASLNAALAKAFGWKGSDRA